MQYDKSLKTNREILRSSERAARTMDESAAKLIDSVTEQTKLYSKVIEGRKKDLDELSALQKEVQDGKVDPEQLFQLLLKSKMIDPNAQGPEAIVSGIRQSFVDPLKDQLDPLKKNLMEARKELKKVEEQITEDNIRHMRARANRPK